MGPQPARSRFRDHLRIDDSDGREPHRVRRPVAVRDDHVRRHAGRGQNRLNLAQHAAGGGLVAGPGGHLDGDSAGRLATPSVRKRQHVGPLRRGEAAAIGADEYFERALALADRDWMALANIVRIVVVSAGFDNGAGGVAAGECRGQPKQDCCTGCAGKEPDPRASRELAHAPFSSSRQSRMKP